MEGLGVSVFWRIGKLNWPELRHGDYLAPIAAGDKASRQDHVHRAPTSLAVTADIRDLDAVDQTSTDFERVALC
jgi:hypothetical protein